jgi:hypothetical protein
MLYWLSLPGALKLETNDSENKTKQNEKQNKNGWGYNSG